MSGEAERQRWRRWRTFECVCVCMYWALEYQDFASVVRHVSDYRSSPTPPSPELDIISQIPEYQNTRIPEYHTRPSNQSTHRLPFTISTSSSPLLSSPLPHYSHPIPSHRISSTPPSPTSPTFYSQQNTTTILSHGHTHHEKSL